MLQFRAILVSKRSVDMDTNIRNNAAFTPGRIGNMELKNRLIVPAMVTNTCTPDGMPTERFIQ